MQVCPRVASAQLNLGTARQRVDDAAGAEVCFHSALYFVASGPRGVLWPWAMFKELGRRQEAEPLFPEASKLDELDADAAYMAALSASERGDFGSELRWLERALKADPKHAKSLVNRAVLYGEAGDLDNELACNRKSRRGEPAIGARGERLARVLGMRGLVDGRWRRLRAGPGLGRAAGRRRGLGWAQKRTSSW